MSAPDWIDRHLNQDFPPRLPDGWDHAMPFSLHRRVDGRWARIVAAVKSLDLPPQYLVEIDNMGFGRAHSDLNGVPHVGEFGYKNPDPPLIADFEEAVKLAEAYLSRALTPGPVVVHPQR